MAAKISKTLGVDFVFNDTSCPICLEPLSAQDRILSPTCCYKVFHYDCLRKWLGEQSLTCPNDRTPIDRRSFIRSLIREDRAALGEQLTEQMAPQPQELTWDVRRSPFSLPLYNLIVALIVSAREPQPVSTSENDSN